MTLHEQISDIISKSLPAMQAQELRQYIETAQNNERELSGARERLKAYDIEIKSLRTLLDSHKAMKLDIDDIAKRKAKLEKEEYESSVKASFVQFKIDSAEKSVQLVIDLFKSVFANSVLRESVLRSRSHMPESTPSNPYPGTFTLSDSDIRTVEKS